MLSPFPLLSAAVALLGTTLAAQQVHVVDASGGPGSQFTEISDAVAAAVTGDTIEVRGGTYAQFEVDKGISVLRSDGFVQVLGGVRVRDVPAGWPVVISGLTFGPALNEYGIDIRDNLGAVHLDAVTRNAIFVGVSIHNSTLVTLRECALLGTDIAVSVTGSNVHMDGCQVTASAEVNGRAGAALRSESSVVYVGGSVLHGGASSFYPGFESPGLHLVSGDVVLGAGTSVHAGIVPPNFSLPVEAIYTEGGSIRKDTAVDVIPFGGSPAILGPAAVTDTVVPAVRVQGAAPGEDFTADVFAPEGSTTVTFIGAASPPIETPLGVFWTSAPRFVVDVGVVPVGGSRTVLMPVPLTFPGGISFAVQAVAVLGGDLHFSTPSVAVVRL